MIARPFPERLGARKQVKLSHHSDYFRYKGGLIAGRPRMVASTPV